MVLCDCGEEGLPVCQTHGDVAQCDRVFQVPLGHRRVVTLMRAPNRGPDAEGQEARHDDAEEQPGRHTLLGYDIKGRGHACVGFPKSDGGNGQSSAGNEPAHATYRLILNVLTRSNSKVLSKGWHQSFKC